MTSQRRLLLGGLSVLGLAAASSSSYVHYQLLTTPNYASFCDVSATVSCTGAYLSRYGTLAGVPVAILGVVFFAVTLVLALLAGRKGPAGENAPGYILALSTIGLAFAIYLAWASWWVLGAFCILCATTYVAVVALFIVSGGATTYPMTSLPRRAIGDLRTLVTSPVALVVLLLLLGGAASLVAMFPSEAPATQAAATTYPPLTDQQRVELEKWWDVQTRVNLPIDPGPARVLLVKFSDYMCPACRQTYEMYKPVLAKFGGDPRFKFILKHYPLESECNPAAPGNHFASCEAAAAVVMARSRGTAERLEEWIFTNQVGLTPDAVKQAALKVGRITDFDQKYQSALQEVKTDASLGGYVQVKQTPTFYLNGRQLPSIPPQALEGLIELELKRAK